MSISKTMGESPAWFGVAAREGSCGIAQSIGALERKGRKAGRVWERRVCAPRTANPVTKSRRGIAKLTLPPEDRCPAGGSPRQYCLIHSIPIAGLPASRGTVYYGEQARGIPLACGWEFRGSRRLEFDSSYKLATARSVVAARAGDAVSQEPEAVDNTSIAPVLRCCEWTSHIQAGVCPAVKDVKKVGAKGEFEPLPERDHLAKAQMLVGISWGAKITVVGLCIGILAESGIRPRSGIQEERGTRIHVVVIEAVQKEFLARNTIRPNCVTKRDRCQSACRTGYLHWEPALVMEDTIGCPAGKECALPPSLVKAE